MIDQKRAPGVGIGFGRGRGGLKIDTSQIIPKFIENGLSKVFKDESIVEGKENEDKLIVEMDNLKFKTNKLVLDDMEKEITVDTSILQCSTDELKKKITVETIYSNDNNDESQYEIRPPRVNFIPDDDIEDYKLHVDIGIHFNKFEDVQVKVTGEDIPFKVCNIADLKITNFLKENIKSLGFKSLTPVQQHTIPIIAANRDVMACAETGSGKTAAFLLPIINAIEGMLDGPKSTRNSPHCIIIVPSRELCRQVYTAAVGLCCSSSIKCGYGYGGVEMNTSLRKIVSCDLLCVTPGRLMQYVNSDIIILDRLSYLVLDEADRLLGIDEFLDIVRLVLSGARVLNNRQLQVSMFSATFPRPIQWLAQEILKDYLFVAVGVVGAANSDIKQTIIQTTATTKLDLTLDYIAKNKLGKTLIFVKRKRLADFYGIRLIEMGLRTTTLHGDRYQSDREQALNDFKSGRVDVLVATDVASRGLDIPKVDTVLNVDMPDDVDVYVHRIGRSGRCGNPGAAVTFFDIEEDYHQAPRLIQILRGSRQPCPSFLTDIGTGFKVRDTLKGSTKDLRNSIARESLCAVAKNTFMNIDDESDEDLAE